jgi:NitT/TauT family transport system substrate-binding protein
LIFPASVPLATPKFGGTAPCRRRRAVLAAAAAFGLFAPSILRAQALTRLRIAVLPGLAALPLAIAQEARLVEKHLAAQGLRDVAVAWTQTGAGTENALLAEAVDFAAIALPALVLLWEKTKGSPREVRALASLPSIPHMLFARGSRTNTIRDFAPDDRIAVPVLRAGLHALLVQMAAAQAFGPQAWNRYENIMVEMPQAEAFAALSGAALAGAEPRAITAHMSGPPQQWTQMRDPHLTRVAESTAITDGPATQNVVAARLAFRERHPDATAAVLDALDEAMQTIRRDLRNSVGIFVRAQRLQLDAGVLAENLRDPNTTFDTTPNRVLFAAQFMRQTGLVKQAPASWRDMWMPEMHARNGS